MTVSSQNNKLDTAYDVVPVQLPGREYNIYVGSEVMDRIGDDPVIRNSSKVVVVTDTNVSKIYLDGLIDSLTKAKIETESFVIPAGEEHKNLKQASMLWDFLIDRRFDRKSTIISLGGGVVGDLAGFAAACFARGIDFVQIPTTLLAMVDAAVGGKVAVDHPNAKNMIGAFHQPRSVYCDSQFLSTLPKRDYRSGLAEVVKYGMIMDSDFFDWLENHVDSVIQIDQKHLIPLIVRCCQLKAQVVVEDEKETGGKRATLNYGHTFAHALETITNYKMYMHGEAVSIGMRLAADYSLKTGQFDRSIAERQNRLLQSFELPIDIETNLSIDALVSSMRSDKKSQREQIRLILPRSMGDVYMEDDTDEAMIRQVYADAMNRS